MKRIGVIGLGYVGLPVALAFARRFPGTVGFDVSLERVNGLRAGSDPTGTATGEELTATDLALTSAVEDLKPCDVYIVCVPTPIDDHRRPDLEPLLSAARTLGSVVAPGDVVVIESTVYPGVTEDVFGPALAAASGLTAGVDFRLGYSPERLNPGDPEHGFEDIRKVIGAQDPETLEVLAECYGAVVEAGIHRAPSIRVAEAAKVIENVQRDLNIALMNELAMLFDRLGLDTRDVLAAAASKWNFHPYTPGLVGGHCIGVDPYYLTSKAESVGFHPQVILAGRRINDGMGAFVAERTVKLLIEAGRAVRGSRVACLGVAFKPNVPDARNTRVVDLVRSLSEFGVEVLVHDPVVSAEETAREHGLELVHPSELTNLDGGLLAVPHRGLADLARSLIGAGASLLVDVGGAVDPAGVPEGVLYWRL